MKLQTMVPTDPLNNKDLTFYVDKEKSIYFTFFYLI